MLLVPHINTQFRISLENLTGETGKIFTRQVLSANVDYITRKVTINIYEPLSVIFIQNLTTFIGLNINQLLSIDYLNGNTSTPVKSLVFTGTITGLNTTYSYESYENYKVTTHVVEFSFTDLVETIH